MSAANVLLPAATGAAAAAHASILPSQIQPSQDVQRMRAIHQQHFQWSPPVHHEWLCVRPHRDCNGGRDRHWWWWGGCSRLPGGGSHHNQRNRPQRAPAVLLDHKSRATKGWRTDVGVQPPILYHHDPRRGLHGDHEIWIHVREPNAQSSRSGQRALDLPPPTSCPPTPLLRAQSPVCLLLAELCTLIACLLPRPAWLCPNPLIECSNDELRTTGGLQGVTGRRRGCAGTQD